MKISKILTLKKYKNNIKKTHFVETHFDWKTKCNKFNIFKKTTMFKEYVTCTECLDLLKDKKLLEKN